MTGLEGFLPLRSLSKSDFREDFTLDSLNLNLPGQSPGICIPTCCQVILIGLRLELIVPGGSDGKASARNAGDQSSIPGSERSPGEGNGNPLQYSCLENSMDGGVWWATVYGVAKSRTRLSDFNQEPVKVRFQGGVYPRLTKSESSRVEPRNLHSNMLPGDSDMAQTLDNQEPFI